MKKFVNLFSISFQQEFAYRLSFILWRLRNVFQMLIFFFLWDGVFSGSSNVVFGYTKSMMLTYAVILIVVRALVLSSRSTDVAGIVANGDVSNLLLKPINFFSYWITRDIASKILNIVFGVVEMSVVILLLKPNLFWQSNIYYLLAFVISLLIAMFIFFCLMMLTSFVPFWMPELSWGAQFLIIAIVVEFLSGTFFPLDVLPNSIFQMLRFTPFPYLVFVPIKIYLGNFDANIIIQSLIVGAIWSLILWKATNYVWKKGLLVYEGVGR